MKIENNFAGFWFRFLAGLLDATILLLIYFILNQIFKLVGVDTSSHHLKMNELRELHPNTWFFYSLCYMEGISRSSLSIFHLTRIIITILYFAVMESSFKQATFGKMAIGIKVTDLNGNRISFPKALLRNFSKLFSNFTLYIGYVMAGFTQKKQALHDIISKSLVIKK